MKVTTNLTGAPPLILPVWATLSLTIPEPGTLLLLGSGVLGLALIGTRKRR
jgi:hypothetical protein